MHDQATVAPPWKRSRNCGGMIRSGRKNFSILSWNREASGKTPGLTPGPVAGEMPRRAANLARDLKEDRLSNRFEVFVNTISIRKIKNNGL